MVRPPPARRQDGGHHPRPPSGLRAAHRAGSARRRHGQVTLTAWRLPPASAARAAQLARDVRLRRVHQRERRQDLLPRLRGGLSRAGRRRPRIFRCRLSSRKDAVIAARPATAGRSRRAPRAAQSRPTPSAQRESRTSSVGASARASACCSSGPRMPDKSSAGPSPCAAGAELVDVPAYRTVLREDGKDDLLAALRAGSLDALTFASSSKRAPAIACSTATRRCWRGYRCFQSDRSPPPRWRGWGSPCAPKPARPPSEGSWARSSDR